MVGEIPLIDGYILWWATSPYLHECWAMSNTKFHDHPSHSFVLYPLYPIFVGINFPLYPHTTEPTKPPLNHQIPMIIFQLNPHVHWITNHEFWIPIMWIQLTNHQIPIIQLILMSFLFGLPSANTASWKSTIEFHDFPTPLRDFQEASHVADYQME